MSVRIWWTWTLSTEEAFCWADDFEVYQLFVGRHPGLSLHGLGAESRPRPSGSNGRERIERERERARFGRHLVCL